MAVWKRIREVLSFLTQLVLFMVGLKVIVFMRLQEVGKEQTGFRDMRGIYDPNVFVMEVVITRE